MAKKKDQSWFKHFFILNQTWTKAFFISHIFGWITASLQTLWIVNEVRKAGKNK